MYLPRAGWLALEEIAGYMIIIRDVKRWSTAASRNMPMPIMEIKQMLGRAGRPKYDKRGDAWIISKNLDDEIKNVEHFLYTTNDMSCYSLNVDIIMLIYKFP